MIGLAGEELSSENELSDSESLIEGVRESVIFVDMNKVFRVNIELSVGKLQDKGRTKSNSDTTNKVPSKFTFWDSRFHDIANRLFSARKSPRIGHYSAN